MSQQFAHLIQKNPSISSRTLYGQVMASAAHAMQPAQLAQIASHVSRIGILCGLKDTVIDPACSYELAAHLNGSLLVELENKGHSVLNEADQQVIQLVESLAC